MKYGIKLRKWAQARNQNTRHVYKLFSDDPNRIEMLDDDIGDPRETALLLMRRTTFEELIQIVSNQKSLQLLIDALYHLHKEPSSEIEAVYKAIKCLK